ncbi:MAG: HEPN domain-containing protein [Chloroflexota bacterium]
MQRELDWLREAESELAAARDLVATGHWAWCRFTSQQVAEKALKAICEAQRLNPYGHNLNMLVQVIESLGPVPPEVTDGSIRLNRFYIPTRYPDAFDQGAPSDQYFETDARQALKDAEVIVSHARDALRST